MKAQQYVQLGNYTILSQTLNMGKKCARASFCAFSKSGLHFLNKHFCFLVFSPPFLGLSRQFMQLSQSVLMQAEHRPQMAACLFRSLFLVGSSPSPTLPTGACLPTVIGNELPIISPSPQGELSLGSLLILLQLSGFSPRLPVALSPQPFSASAADLNSEKRFSKCSKNSSLESYE